MSKIDVITIDGPAGAGKSVASRLLAARLGVEYLNTGAMYRAIALKGLREGIDLTDEAALTALARAARIESRNGATFLDGEDVSDAVRSPEVSQTVKYPANAPTARALMADLQRKIGLERPVVTEGRDQGTAVFPDAKCKFYLTASPEERARRRSGEYRRRGESVPFDLILRQIIERDRQDSEREIGPLKEPEDAIRIESDGKTIDEVVAEMEKAARAKLNL
ncbi:MAG: (d)CMP kinase [Thermoguttaceae bacterium]|nr:(d)CMP kinase [Thermoguttaceae bacterium]